MVAQEETLKDKGNKAFAAKEFKKAAKLYRDAIKLDPENPVLYSNRAISFIKLEDYERALKDCNDALELKLTKPVKIKLLYRKGLSLIGLQKHQEAGEILKAVLKEDPSNQAALKELENLSNITVPEMKRNQEKKENSADKEKEKYVWFPIEVVDELPHDFNFKKSSDKLSNAQVKNKEQGSLEDQLSQIEGVTLPKIIKTKSTSSSQIDATKTNNSSPAQRITDFPESPTIYYLSSLNKLTGEERQKHYFDVVLLKPAKLQSIFKSSGLDADFLEYLIDAVIWSINTQQKESDDTLLALVQCIPEIPRFSFVSMFCPSSKINKMAELIKEKYGVDVITNWN